ncbi:ABC transporter permease [Pseudoalteromonas sp. SMS1]|uniref:ABC transporter permease n=1 Tax=Pseudoalteromonas sp. SMS1 TaxID=2908894 RepID=UPI001F1921A3|nr:ABC transporter permease [Pseudoalteromonas sp. SMS1]MCF2856432.1 ABC transporter permease [Pseudoalteromonas sp. SMS1]
MVGYYIKLAWLSLRKTPLLSMLMIGTIAIGIAAAMITITVGYMMAQDPLPHKSDRVAMVHLNSWDPTQPYGYRRNGKNDIPSTLTYQDAMALLKADKADKHTLFAQFSDMIRTTTSDVRDAQLHPIRSTTRDFFDMFGVPFIYGGTWSKEADLTGEQVIVLSKHENDRLFDGVNSVGKEVHVGTLLFRVVGVIDDWQPTPRFYTHRYLMYQSTLRYFVPLESQIRNALFSPTSMGFSCWGDDPNSTLADLLLSECVWLHLWVEFDSVDKKDDYFGFLSDYSEEQRKVGRFARPEPNRLMTVPEYLEKEGALSNENIMGIWFSLAFLLACLCNVMSLMMTKFHGKGGEIGLRRAVGASKKDIIIQFGFESIFIGLVGGVLGLLFAQVGLSVLADMFSNLHQSVMTMDIFLMVGTVGLAMSTSLLFGLWPIYRASQIQPSSQLKSL